MTPDNGKPWSTPAVSKPVYTDEQEAFNDFLLELTVEFAKGQGMYLHYLYENPEQYGIERENNFGDAETDYDAYVDLCKKYKQRMAGFDYSELTPGQQVNYDRLMYEFGLALQLPDLNKDTYCSLFSENGNVINNLSTMMTEYAFINEKDIQDYFETLTYFRDFSSEVISIASDAYLQKGCLMTEAMLDTTIEYIDGIMVKTDNPLIEAFSVNIKEAGLSDEENEAYIKQYKDYLESYVYPGLQEIKDYVNGIYNLCDEEPFGMASLPGGKEYFEYLAQGTLGVNMSADQMFDYLDGKFAAEYQELVKLASFHSDVLNSYPNDSYTIEDPRVILDSLKEYIKTNYPAINDTKYTVSELPDALRVDGVLAYFLTPQYDNGARKVIRFNPDGIEDCTSFFSTLAHEGYPGHLYQQEFFSHCEGYQPINMLLNYTGYMEGWAVIAGQDAYHYILDDENLANLYMLDYNLTMDMAAIVAIGMHYKGWSEADVKSYLSKYNYGAYADFFYETVATDPVVYLPYTAGRYLMQDTLNALKDKGYTDIEAKTAVLNIGPCSFEVMWQHLNIDENSIY